MSHYEKEKRLYAKVIVKAWTDDAFRAELLADPKKILNENGFDIPAEVSVAITPNSAHHKVHLGLPAKPVGTPDEEAAYDLMFFCLF